MNTDTDKIVQEETAAPVNGDNAENVQLQNKIGELEDKYKRALADYVNLQRRTDEQRVSWMLSANKQLLLKLLPILDTLMLAQRHSQDKGLELSIDQFLRVLEEEGVKRIKTVGEMFDPHTMECVTTQEGEEGKVLEEVRVGFTQSEFVLRSAQVVVGRKKE